LLGVVHYRDAVVRRGPFGFAPAFSHLLCFELDPYRVVEEARLWPWLTLRGFCRQMGGLTAYAEGCFADMSPSLRPASGDVWDRELDGAVL
jgi:hypothetical protein